MLLPGTLFQEAQAFLAFPVSHSPSCTLSRSHLQMERQAKPFAHPSLPWAASVPALGLWLRSLLLLPSLLPFLPISAVAVFLPQKLQLLRQNQGRKSGLTTCWWTDEAPGLAWHPKDLEGQRREKKTCPPEFSFPPTFSWQLQLFWRRPSSESRAFLACREAKSCHPARNLHLEP